ncbi:MAG: triose-phosphate isomerase [Actinomycetota bacterium]|nr:triose-phosphate isomerase [Actinomycetota bacterium]
MKYVLANWKMYTTLSQDVEIFTKIQRGLLDRAQSDLPRVIVFPSFPSLPVLAKILDRRVLRLGAQNCHWEAAGPYTGEVSPTMLTGLVEYVLLGHSDRRAAGETDEQIAKKVRAAATAGLTPVLFVGEDQPTDSAIGHAEQRLTLGLAEVDHGMHDVLVVYEPTWAVGADAPADAGRVREVVAHLKKRLTELGARRTEIIYGGTVTADNVGQFLGLDILDGVGATRASLDEHTFLRIIDQITAGRVDV